MNIGKKLGFFMASLILIFSLAACSTQEETNSAPNESANAGNNGNNETDNENSNESKDNDKQNEVPPEPVTLAMYNHFNNISEEQYTQYIIEPLAEKLPHITFEVIRHGSGSTINELVAANAFPDFYYGSNVGFPSYLNLELQRDMSDLIEKHDFDLSRFEDYAVEAIQHFGENGEMYAVPFSTNVGVMLYNKDIFDQFGVDYPTDNMTWNEVADLGNQLTRFDDGTQYIGFDPNYPTRFASGLSLEFVDEENKKALIDTPEVRKIFEVFQKVYSQPGFVSSSGKYDYNTGGFLQDQTVAMIPVWILQVRNFSEQLSQMNWDIVSIPNFEGHVGRGREVDFPLMAVSTTSQHRDAAMEVLKVVTSDEVQTIMSEHGTPSILKNQQIKDLYGSKLPLFEGKNVGAVFKTTPGPMHNITNYDGIVRKLIDDARADIAAGKDLNTLIRELQEEADQQLQAEMK